MNKPNIFTFALFFAIFYVSTEAIPQCLPCVDCAKCARSEHFSPGWKKITVDLSSCKNGSTISWACCLFSDGANDCDLYSCDNADTNDWDPSKNKCNELTEISFVVPESSQNVTLQLHDGLFSGTVNPDAHPWPICGGSSGACSSPSGVCQVTIPLSSCLTNDRECESDADCHHLTQSCATGICDQTTGTCREILHVDTICRPKVDACDVLERCDGVHPTCPPDLRRDYAYSFKCGTDQFLCGAKKEELVLLNEGTNARGLGGCNMGSNLGTIYELPWPHCVDDCIEKTCPNGRGLSNYVLAKCQPETGDWVCTSKVDVGDVYVTQCPYLGL